MDHDKRLHFLNSGVGSLEDVEDKVNDDMTRNFDLEINRMFGKKSRNKNDGAKFEERLKKEVDFDFPRNRWFEIVKVSGVIVSLSQSNNLRSLMSKCLVYIKESDWSAVEFCCEEIMRISSSISLHESLVDQIRVCESIVSKWLEIDKRIIRIQEDTRPYSKYINGRSWAPIIYDYELLHFYKRSHKDPVYHKFDDVIVEILSSLISGIKNKRMDGDFYKGLTVDLLSKWSKAYKFEHLNIKEVADSMISEFQKDLIKLKEINEILIKIKPPDEEFSVGVKQNWTTLMSKLTERLSNLLKIFMKDASKADFREMLSDYLR